MYRNRVKLKLKSGRIVAVKMVLFYLTFSFYWSHKYSGFTMWYAAAVRFIRRRIVLGIIFVSSLTYCIVNFSREGSHRNMGYQDIPIENKLFVWQTFQEHHETNVRNSVQGKFLRADDRGCVPKKTPDEGWLLRPCRRVYHQLQLRELQRKQQTAASFKSIPYHAVWILASYWSGRRRWWAVAVGAALLVGALVALVVLHPWAGRDHPRFRRATVAANGYECAAIGRSILEKNGSAVDAAIATLFCEGIACAQCMGLGGGFLATVYDASTRRVRVLNAREHAPRATHQDMFANASSTVGGLAVAIPGELKGYGALHREYGTLPWEELVQPTAELCRKGHRVNAYMARVLGTYGERIKAEPSMRELYVNPATGKVWVEGDYIKEPVLAKTLDIIATEGPEAMHNGSLTAALARDIQKHGGIVTEEDLRTYSVKWQDPITVPLSGGRTLYSVPLPGSGAVLAFILNMLRGWVGAGTDAPVNSNLYWHRIVETFKFAYAKRTGLGDPAHVNLPFDIIELERNLSHPEWAHTYRNEVDDARTYSDWRHYGALFEGADDHGTAHVVVVAPDGSVVSVTSTVNYIWGSQRRSQSLGILLNNQMDDFAIPMRESSYGMPPSPANMLAPGLQPLSSMVPSVVLNREGLAELVLGAAGGTKITTQVALTVLHTMEEDFPLSEVIQRPRLHHQLMPMEIEFESDFTPSIIEYLRQRGHATTERGPTAGFAAVTGSQRGDDGYLTPSTDRRRVGSIDGF